MNGLENCAWWRNRGMKDRRESVFRWFGHIERMENDRIVKRVYVGECVDNRLVGRPWKS